MMRKTSDNNIPNNLYKEIHRVMPILCVDLIAIRNGSFLLVKRKNAPAKNEWWFPGGRILKGETFEKAAKRKLLQETNLIGNEVTLLGVEETFFPDGPFGDPTHSINAVMLARVEGKETPRVDEQSEDARWFETVDKKWDTYVKKYLELAGFTK